MDSVDRRIGRGPENTWKERIKEFGPDSSGILRDGKRSHYEGGHRVPCAIRWPAVIEAERVWEQLAGQVDMMATIASRIGIEIPDEAAEDSESFASILLDRAADYERGPMIHTNNRDGHFVITEGRWKLIIPAGDNGRELYNLAVDVGETNNVIDRHPTVAEALEAKLTAIVCSGRSSPGIQQRHDTGWWPAVNWLTSAEYDARHLD